jgi:hypothetical protein
MDTTQQETSRAATTKSRNSIFNPKMQADIDKVKSYLNKNKKGNKSKGETKGDTQNAATTAVFIDTNTSFGAYPDVVSSRIANYTTSKATVKKEYEQYKTVDAFTSSIWTITATVTGKQEKSLKQSSMTKALGGVTLYELHVRTPDNGNPLHMKENMISRRRRFTSFADLDHAVSILIYTNTV